MKTSRLSQLFFIACDRIHQAVDDLYEVIHNETGEPVRDKDDIEEAIADLKTAMYHELDLIKSAVDEFQDKQ
jgi:hypothetical protein|tara:strand:- start:166 stop:381 length:216 start_codon:yes stop_codon:yes gene_type:complete